MPLLDHFRPPVEEEMPWDEFHPGWATRIADQLTELLPPDFRARESVKAAGGYEIDVATFRRPDHSAATDPGLNDAERAGWQPPPARAVAPTITPERFEVRVISLRGGRQLVGAIELVSPSNKDRPAERDAFLTKVASYLQEGVCVVILDPVTSLRANLHNELVERCDWPDMMRLPANLGQYAVTYRPTLRGGVPAIDVWSEQFRPGDPLPTMPLRLTGDLFVPVDFEAAYMEACRKRKLLP